MRQTNTQLTEARAEVLLELSNAGGELTGIASLARRLDVDRSTAHHHVKNLEDQGMIELSPHPNGSQMELTRSGWQRIHMITGGSLPSNTVGEGKAETFELYAKRLHGVVARLTPYNSGTLPDEWRGRVQRRSDLEWVHVQRGDQDQYVAVVAGFSVQLHRKSITVHMRNPVEGWAVRDCLAELVDRIQDVADKMERATGVRFRADEVELGRQEIGIEEHHLAMLADDLPGVSLQDIWVEDPENPGQKEVIMDKSPGLPETETLGHDRAAEVAHTIEDELRQLAHDPGAVKFRHAFERLAQEQDLDPEVVVDELVDLVQDDGVDDDGETVEGRVEAEDSGGKTRDGNNDAYSYDDWNELDGL
jgi:DNA-binding transcriptional ArsR family regulator